MSALAGRSVVVTRGGTGIGAACARRAARAGAAVSICGRTEERLLEVADEIRSTGSTVQHVVADVTKEDDVERLVSAAVGFGGGLHGVVANAGGGGALAPYHRQHTDEFLRVLHLNVLGTMLCIKHAVPHLVAAGGGSFVGMSSLAGGATHPWFGAYTVGKAGIEAMIRNAADEYGPVGVRFNAVRPGFIATEIMEGIERGGPVWNSYVEQTPLGDVGQPEDVANLVLFLLSDDSRWITGETVSVDGGHHLRRGPDFSSYVEPAIGIAAPRAPRTTE